MRPVENIEEIMLRLGETLRERRKTLGMTQEDLAEATGVMQPHIARFERFGPKSIQSLLVMCQTLGMNVVLVEDEAVELAAKALEDGDALEELIDHRPLKPLDLVQRCPIHGIPLGTNLKCLQKGCKYA